MVNIKHFKTHKRYLEYYQNYRKKNREKLRAYNREYNKKYRLTFGYNNEIKWAENNPEKVKVKQLLQYAIKTKMIKRKPCAVCGKIKPVHGHHSDYSKPLEVIWLCPLHHKQLHLGYLKSNQINK